MDRSGDVQVAMKRPRRCVQSKLSFSLSPQANGLLSAATAPDAVTDDEDSDSEGKKYKAKRKRNVKTKLQYGDPVEFADNGNEAKELSSQRKKSNKNLKTKKSRGTPRKNRTPIRSGHGESSSKRRLLNCKYDNAEDCDNENEPFCDLWSEAKKAAEENLRLSAGKQTHPFFSICKATKKISETKQSNKYENSICLSPDGDYCLSLPPVHVFDAVKDDVAAPNWKNWNLLETSLQKLHGYCSMETLSMFNVSTKSLILGAACGKEVKIDCLLTNEKMDGVYKATSSCELSSAQLSKGHLPLQLEMVHVACNFSCSSTQGSCADEDQDKAHKERLLSYYERCICCLDCSLWTEKYRPKVSLEVCGNAKSVKFLSEWLKSWQDRGVQNTANEHSRNQSTNVESEDSFYIDYSDVDELDGRESHTNVLLISGPTGSGKSAAIYACAREQGFKVIEVNASSLRNGAYMRQTFGEGVDSLGLTHWLAEDQTNQQSKDVLELLSGMPIVAENGLETHSFKSPSKSSTDKNSHFHIANKTLILFEEVDVVFDEDHGFVSMILTLAESTKRPIILTSNTRRPDLPNLLDRLVLDFKVPSYSELLYHASMVCAFEKIHISLNLLDHIISACLGDIRRILMLLQFWCQGFKDITGKMFRCTKSMLPFDITAVHLAIPKVIPLGFCCELSEKVDEEISNVVCAMEENSIVKIFLQHKVNLMENIDPLQNVNTTSAVKFRKKGKLRKHSIVSPIKSSDDMNHLQDLYDLDSPSIYCHKASKRKCVMLSSQSDEGYSSSDDLKSKNILAKKDVISSDVLIPECTSAQNQEIYGPSQLDQLDDSRTSFAVQYNFDISEEASTSHVCDATRTQNVACMPELSSTSWTETNPDFTFISQEISHNSEFNCLFDSNISPPIQPGVDMNSAVDNIELSKHLEKDISTADIFHQGNHEIGFFQNEHGHGYSRCKFVDNIVCSQEVLSIPETWRRLRSCDENRKLLLPNSKDVSLVASLASGVADLISDADILFSTCNPVIYDNLEPTSTPYVEPDSFSWYEDQVEMGSTIAQHGLCLYTTKFSSVASCLGCNNTSDLAQEMLISSTSSTALGKLILQESFIGQNSCFKDSDVKKTLSVMPIGSSEPIDDLYSAILPIVPTRLSMVLKGVAFHEYLSYVGHISRFECSRLSGSLVEKQKRRRRARTHYLTSGAHQLSSEQAELLAQSCSFNHAAAHQLSSEAEALHS